MPVSPELCDSIADLRRKIQTVGAEHVLFLDEAPFKLSETESHTLVLPGESAYVEVDDTSSYAPRYDMIAACSETEVLPPLIFTPSERDALGVSGINQPKDADQIHPGHPSVSLWCAGPLSPVSCARPC